MKVYRFNTLLPQAKKILVYCTAPLVMRMHALIWKSIPLIRQSHNVSSVLTYEPQMSELIHTQLQGADILTISCRKRMRLCGTLGKTSS